LRHSTEVHQQFQLFNRLQSVPHLASILMTNSAKTQTTLSVAMARDERHVLLETQFTAEDVTAVTSAIFPTSLNDYDDRSLGCEAMIGGSRYRYQILPATILSKLKE
jgi:hypothetical protein